MDRRQFLTRTAAGGAGLAFGPGVWAAVYGQEAVPGAGPYGSLDGIEADENGILLPAGFTSRRLATSGDAVAGTGYEWHIFPDGGATYADGDGWIYVSNSEAIAPGTGGVSALRFDAAGTVTDAYRILGDTTWNCAGGPTPWGTWLSCEEFDFHDNAAAAADFGSIAGRVWETDPAGVESPVVLPAMGLFQHEAAAIDPDLEYVYLTEDQPDGRLYRFSPAAYPSFDEGALEVAQLDDDVVTWLALPDPSAADRPTRQQVPESTAFAGGEGIWFHDGHVYFTTKLDNKVHALETATDAYRVVYDAEAMGEAAPLRGVDNITVEEGSGDLYVAEDGGSMQIVLITPDGDVAPFLQVLGQDASEITGPAFSPDGTRLYLSSQRGTDGHGITYEVEGPFRGPGVAAASTTTTTVAPGDTLASAAEGADESATGDADTGSDSTPLIIGGAVAAVAVAGGAAVAIRRRRQAD